jgi:hypothetical protein
VTIAGFENLTVKSTSGATLVQPSVIPTNGIFITLLRINSSRNVTIDGLNISSEASKPIAIGIGGGSTDVRLRNLNVVGGSYGVIIFENSQVSIARVTKKNSGGASVGIYDKSDVHVEDCLFEDTTGTLWHVGFDIESGHLTIHRTTIRNMNVGAYIRSEGSMDTGDFNTYYPLTKVSDVVIDNPAGLNYDGFVIDGNSSLNVGSAKLRILNAGQTGGGNSAAIWLSGGSTLNGNSNLIISGSRGQGIFLEGNSHATLDSSTITGSLHGGVVAVNQSTVSVVLGDPPTTISGNAVDVFCDTKSLITGGLNIANATTTQCPNLLPYDTPPIP